MAGGQRELEAGCMYQLLAIGKRAGRLLVRGDRWKEETVNEGWHSLR